MAKTIIVFFALTVFVAHCHVLKNKEPETMKSGHSRGKRSCYVCENNGHGPPPPPHGFPPPPPFFRSWHWNRHGSGNDGSQQKAFTAAGGQASGNYDGQSAGYGGEPAQPSRSQNGVEFGDHPYNSFQSGYNQQLKGHGGAAGGQGFENQKQMQSADFNARRTGQGRFGGCQSNSASSAPADDSETSPSGCSTCDKSGYAVSNAKSVSGNAIAVSIGR